MFRLRRPVGVRPSGWGRTRLASLGEHHTRETFTDPRLCAAFVGRFTFGGNIIETGTGTDSYRLASDRAARAQMPPPRADQSLPSPVAAAAPCRVGSAVEGSRSSAVRALRVRENASASAWTTAPDSPTHRANG